MSNKYKSKACSGFTLMEVLLAVILFGVIVSGLAAIYGASHRYMAQSFRQNVMKDGLTMAMRTIQQDLAIATIINTPPVSVFVDSSGNELKGISNAADDGTLINDDTGVTWFYVCLNGSTLWHDNGTITGGPPWNVFPAVSCGSGATARRLLENVNVSASNIFTRPATNKRESYIGVQLTIKRLPTDSGANITSRPIISTLVTTVTINSAISPVP